LTVKPAARVFLIKLWAIPIRAASFKSPKLGGALELTGIRVESGAKKPGSLVSKDAGAGAEWTRPRPIDAVAANRKVVGCISQKNL
jgi:hypothetical protein